MAENRDSDRYQTYLDRPVEFRSCGIARVLRQALRWQVEVNPARSTAVMPLAKIAQLGRIEAHDMPRRRRLVRLHLDARASEELAKKFRPRGAT